MKRLTDVESAIVWLDEVIASTDQAQYTRGERKDARVLKTEIQRLKDALKPFADEAGRYDPPNNDDNDWIWDSEENLTLGHLRAARAALAEPKEDNSAFAKAIKNAGDRIEAEANKPITQIEPKEG